MFLCGHWSAGREKGVPTPSRPQSALEGSGQWSTKSYIFCQKRAFLPTDNVFADTLKGNFKTENISAEIIWR